MSLTGRIADAGLAPSVSRTFANGLREVAAADGYVTDIEGKLISHLIDDFYGAELEAAPFEALWSCAELFLCACITVAVSDGPYDVEEARLISLFATVVLMWVLVTKDQLRCFARHDHHKKATFKSSCIAPKNWNTLHQVNTKLMRLYTFEFRTAICMNVWLVKGRKAKTVQIYHGHSMEKIGRSKRSFSS